MGALKIALTAFLALVTLHRRLLKYPLFWACLVLCLLRITLYSNPVLGSAEEDKNIESVLGIAWVEDAKVVHPLMPAHVLMAIQDVVASDHSATKDIFKSNLTSCMRDTYDEAAELLDYERSTGEVDSGIVTPMTADQLIKRGLLLLHEEDQINICVHVNGMTPMTMHSVITYLYERNRRHLVGSFNL